MKRVLKWVGLGLGGLMLIGFLIPKDTAARWESENRARAAQHAAAKALKAEADAANAGQEVAAKASKAQTDAASNAATKAEIIKRLDEAMRLTLGHEGGWSADWSKGRWMVVTVEIPEGDRYNARTIGTKGVIAVRNQFYKREIAGMNAESYRVTVNGPSPGPDMITRYGSAYLAGGKVDWIYGSGR